MFTTVEQNHTISSSDIVFFCSSWNTLDTCMILLHGAVKACTLWNICNAYVVASSTNVPRIVCTRIHCQILNSGLLPPHHHYVCCLTGEDMMLMGVMEVCREIRSFNQIHWVFTCSDHMSRFVRVHEWTHACLPAYLLACLFAEIVQHQNNSSIQRKLVCWIMQVESQSDAHTCSGLLRLWMLAPRTMLDISFINEIKGTSTRHPRLAADVFWWLSMHCNNTAWST